MHVATRQAHPWHLGLGNALDWQPRTGLHWLGLNLLAAVAYWLFGQFGMALSIGPARFSVLWPANGLALALVLAWGPRVLPGLLLGSLPALVLRTPELNQAALYELGLALAVRCGSLLQWWLQLRWLSPWGALLQSGGARLATRFTLSTLVCCTLAPTLGLLALWTAGRVESVDVVPTWVIWWSGDAAGTLVFAPIILTLLHRRVRAHVLANQTFPMLALGLGLTMATTAMLGELGRIARVDRASAEARAFAQGFQGQLALNIKFTSRLLKYIFLNMFLSLF